MADERDSATVLGSLGQQIVSVTPLFPVGGVRLEYEFYRDDTKMRSSVEFEKVRAFRWRAGAYFTPMLLEASSKLVEIADSAYVQELLSAVSPVVPHKWSLRHFAVLVEDFGVWEIIAADARLGDAIPVEQSEHPQTDSSENNPQSPA